MSLGYTNVDCIKSEYQQQIRYLEMVHQFSSVKNLFGKWLPHSHSKRNKVTHLPESDKITVLAILESLLHAGKTSDSERTVLHRKAAW
ncbi:hypothetical protein [Symbiopectobacterium purcellii]|uniref:hypothetical protein n=1 Tax=Symbiopectobacterium purcellii TaxID=2871826 RepID=UPI003F84FCFA